MSEIIDIYYNQIKDYKLLTYEEEIELGKRIKEGDEEARNLLIQSNLRLVLSVARKYQKSGIPIEDFVQAGNLGLIKATEKWDYTQGYKFSTCATWWIYSFVSRYFYNNFSELTYATNKAEKFVKLHSFLSKCQDEGQNPTYEEISLATGIPVKNVKTMMENYYNIISIDNENENDDELYSNNCFEDSLVDRNAESIEEEVNYNIITEDIDSVIENLNEKELDIIKCRYGFYGKYYSLDEVGKKYNVTRERIRQIESKALFKLKKEMSDKYSDYYEENNYTKVLSKGKTR